MSNFLRTVSIRLEEIQIAYGEISKKDKRKILDRLSDKCGVSVRSIHYRLNGTAKISETELPFFIEELNLNDNN